MRTFIRTSHEQRRRSSAAASAEQVAYMAALSGQQQSRPTLPGFDTAKYPTDVRRSSLGELPARGPPSPLVVPDRRRASVANLPANSSPSFIRRRWNFERGKPPLKRVNTFSMEIRKSSIWATVLIICGSCVFVILLSYAIKSYL